MLASLKGLRGTRLDIFGYTEERRKERRLIDSYKQIISELLLALNEDNYDVAVEIASLPEQIRGFGHIKLNNIRQAEHRQGVLLDRLYHRDKTIHRLEIKAA